MTRYFALMGFLAALWLPAGALALGLGEIRLNSALNQPLDAEIELISPSSAELAVLKADVAARDTFDRYGLDRPEFLNSFRFAVDRGADGAPVLRVTSTRPMPEPFITFLVEADWEKGRLLREYTVLLDPPAFMPEEGRQAPADVAAPRPSTSPSRPLSGSVVRPADTAPVASTPGTPARPVSPRATAGEYGPVRRNENLWNIAAQYRDSSVTMNQMMLAIYEANPQAFANNINHLKQGATLRIPDVSAARRIERSQALATAKSHNDAWRSGRPQTATAVASAGPGAGSSAGEPSSRLELVSPAASDSRLAAAGNQLQEARRELSEQQARAQSAEEQLATARAELEEARRLIDVRDNRLAEMQSRLGEAGADTTDIEQPAPAPVATDAGVDLAPQPEPAPDTVTAAPGDVAGTAEVAAEPQPPAVAPPVAKTPVKAAPATVEPPGLLDKLKGLWPWLLVGVLAIAGGAGALAFKRRQAKPEAWEQDADDATSELDTGGDGATVLHTPSPTQPVSAQEEEGVEYFEDTGTFKPVDFEPDTAEETVKTGLGPAITPVPETAASGEYAFEDTMSSETGLELDQSDPLAEADFHMAYGLYDQAAELVGKAAAREPARRDLQLKLLEIYFVWGNKEAFLESAQRLFDTQEEAPPGEWDKILIMGKQICPDAALFSGEATVSVAQSGSVDLELAGGGMEALDFETGEESASIDLDLGEALSAGANDGDMLDFDFDDSSATGALDDSAELGALRDKIESNVLDTEDTAEMDVESIGLDLDIGDTAQPAGETAPEAGAEVKADDDDLGLRTGIFEDFDILGDSEDSASDSAETAEVHANAETSEMVAIDEDFDFDFDAMDAAGEPEQSTERDLPAVESAEVAAEDVGDFSGEIETLSDDAIDLDLGDLLDEQTGETVAAKILPGDFRPDAAAADAAGAARPDDETVQTPAIASDDGDDFADVFGMSDETVKADISELNLGGDDDDFAAIFGTDDATVKADISQLNVDAALPGFDDDTVNADMSDLDIDLGGEPAGEDTDITRELKTAGNDSEAVDLDVGDSQAGAEESPTTMTVPAAELALPFAGNNELNEVGTKLDLARAYVDMGDPDGARGILEEVIDEGDEKQQRDARELLESLA